MRLGTLSAFHYDKEEVYKRKLQTSQLTTLNEILVRQ